MGESLIVVVQVQTKQGMGPRQAEAFRDLAPVVRQEPGCLRYELHAVAEDPDRFVILEEWASRSAIVAHDASPHMRQADAANLEFRACPASVTTMVAKPVA